MTNDTKMTNNFLQDQTQNSKLMSLCDTFLCKLIQFHSKYSALLWQNDTKVTQWQVYANVSNTIWY